MSSRMNGIMVLFVIVIMGQFQVAEASLNPSKFRAWSQFSLETDPGTLEPMVDTIIHGTYSQKLNHFNPFDNRKFNERYWISNQYAVSSDSPVIFYICGEADCTDHDVTSMLPWAKTINASVVVIEHRFYGQSQPFSQLTTANLKYMTVNQALEDFAQVVRYMKHDLGMSGPWIVAGGSYSGMLSSSFRLKYPELVRGAWSSSGPLNIYADYQGYDQKMVEDMGPECAAQLRSVIQIAEKAVHDPATLAQLRHQFGADDLTDVDDFLFSITDVAAAAVQYRFTAMLCNNLKSSPDPVTAYTAFAKQAATDLGYLPSSYSFGAATDLDAHGPNANLRVFFYQQCTEIGLFQTAYKDPAVSVRSQRLDMNYMRRGCERLFGKGLSDSTAVFRQEFFEPTQHRESLSEVYYTNGSTDPFGLPGIAAEFGTWNNRGVYAQMIEGGAHCDDLSFRREPDDAHKQAHAQIRLLLKKWTRPY